MKLQKPLVLAALIFSVLVPFVPAAQGAPVERNYAQAPHQISAAITRIRSRSVPGERVRVIVGLAEGRVPQGRLTSLEKAAYREKISSSRRQLMSRLPRGRVAERRRFLDLPFVVMEVEVDQLGELSSLPEVASIEEDILDRPALSSSNDVIRSAVAWEVGYNGEGQSVAILDTGVDASHPFFSATGKVIAEACFSTNSPGQGGIAACPGALEFDSGPGAASPCEASGCDHGTHIAGTIAGNDLTGPHFGVARGADLVAVQVFTNFENPALCGGAGSCALSYASDQIAALDYIYSIHDDYNIAAVNLSFGAGAYEGFCDDSEVGRKAAIDRLRAVGVATMAASGNDGSNGRIQAPACISSVISVGATDDADNLANFTNISEALDLLAPGVGITSAAPGGGLLTLSGTSMAVPHVSGAWAILKQFNPGASVDQVFDMLQSSGVEITGNGNPVSLAEIPRIDLAAALTLEPPLAVPDTAGTFVPLAGCRLVDTRLSGLRLTPMLELEFGARQGRLGMAGQGGASAGCDIPANAYAMQATLTVISDGAGGFLRAWAAGTQEPLATVLAWTRGSVSNSIVLPLCDSAACPGDFVIKLYGNSDNTELVVDVQGYYQR